jgi:glutaredoxin
VIHSTKIKLFSHNECVHCVAARKFLSAHQIFFEEVDVEYTPGALQELTKLTGSPRHVPVLAVNEEVFIDFDSKIGERIVKKATS